MQHTLDHLSPDRLDAILEWRTNRTIDSVLTVLHHPHNGNTFAQALRSVFEIAGLSVDKAEDYALNFHARYTWLRAEKTWFGSVFGAFDCLNNWALADTFGLDLEKDFPTFTLVRDSLWLTLTSMNPGRAYPEDHSAYERLRRLGIKEVQI